MTVLVIVVSALIVWLLHETKWLTIRLSDGTLPTEETKPVVKTEAAALPQLRGMVETVAQLRRSWMLEIMIYLAAIIAAEVVTVFLQPLAGIITHIGILATVIVRSPHTADKLQRQLILSLALVTLVRVISLSVPLMDIPQTWWYPIMYGPLLVSAVVVMRILGFSRGDVGLTFRGRSLLLQAAVIASGFGLGLAEYHILRPESWILALNQAEAWQAALMLGMCTGFVEEFIFRGVLQRSAWERWGWRGLIYVSVLFAILHIGFLSWVDVVFVFGVAMYFAWVVKKTGSLFGVTLAHALTNITLYLIAPLLF